MERKKKKTDSIEASVKRLKIQIGQIAETVQENKKGKLSSQPAQVKAITILKHAEPYKPPILFPNRLKESKQDKQFFEIFDMLSKVNINLPLLDVIRNMPAYAKFFKELNSNKRRYGNNKKVMVSKTASAVLQQQLPPKAMLDLGASINLIPYSTRAQLGLGELKPTTMSLQLAGRSIKYPRGIVEDVLIQVGKMIIPADFVVLDMECTSTRDKE
ncbi:uncharacterized protein LOC125369823 [Ricinus communis]|uniref:uncharacterized protein LOC125369823 n=1 Tax=Ricinus communis TaxID=3988 RepID=UPI00201AD12D|nr:uncharacterized protein LOC125369823 [Ricinus communis]